MLRAIKMTKNVVKKIVKQVLKDRQSICLVLRDFDFEGFGIQFFKDFHLLLDCGRLKLVEDFLDEAREFGIHVRIIPFIFGNVKRFFQFFFF